MSCRPFSHYMAWLWALKFKSPVLAFLLYNLFSRIVFEALFSPLSIMFPTLLLQKFWRALVGGKFYLKIGVWPTQWLLRTAHPIFLHECVFCLKKWRQKPYDFWVGGLESKSSSPHFSRNCRSKNYAQNSASATSPLSLMFIRWFCGQAIAVFETANCLVCA